MSYAQQFLFRMAVTAGHDATRRTRQALPRDQFSARSALTFALYEMEGRR